MQYVFLHNFRGFSDTILPLRQITFLVGENSTGKSSFLRACHMLSLPKVWLSPQSVWQEEDELGGFGDMVSASSQDRSFFQVGLLSSCNGETEGTLSCSFLVCTFQNQSGMPRLSRYMRFSDGVLRRLVFCSRRVRFNETQPKVELADEQDVLAFFLDVVRNDRGSPERLSLLPKYITSDMPPPIVLHLITRLDKGEAIGSNGLDLGVPFPLALTWIAPIRTRPQRFYDGTRRTYSPEGDHMPFLLRRSLPVKATSTDFARKLKTFGDASGLFETIFARAFAKSAQSPIEILVKFSGQNFNISNVGYGVSQVLPLIVEFLSRERGRSFAVQQPEVHLHPRAQAALGALVAELAVERGHRFILETHSDYLIDRCRLELAKKADTGAQVVFFQRTSSGNKATVLPIDQHGKYPTDQPPEFRDFFIKEQMSLLDL